MKNFSYLAYGANALLAVFLAMLVYSTTRDAMQSADSVDHTLEVMRQISALEGSLGRAEAAQRGYLLYAEPSYLGERDASLDEARAHVEVLRMLTRDNFAQAARLQELAGLLERRAERMKTSSEARRVLGAVPELRQAIDSGRRLGARLHEMSGEMSSAEQRLLDLRRDHQAASFQATRATVASAIVIFAVIILAGLVLNQRSMRARRQAERSILDLAESLPGAVFQYRVFPDGRSRYDLLSSSTEKLLGVNRTAALSDANVILDTVLEPDRALLMQSLAQHATTVTPRAIDYRADTPGGVRWIRSISAPRRQDDGSIVWSGHWEDVTERREMEAELVRSKDAADAASRAKSTFLATMSHEIRTPMNGVLGMLELLSLSRLDPEQVATLNVVRESGKSLLRIIDDILDFSKVEAGKLDLVPERMSLREVIERVWSMYSGTASSKGLLLKRFFDQRIGPAHIGDPVRVQQILGNFVSNALKFTHAGGASLSAHLVERRASSEIIQFTVTDSGVGLSPEQQAKLFEPFTQVHDPSGARTGGTGLGLSISQRLASLMGGTIEMESEPGRGTRMTFTVELPVADTELASATPAHSPALRVGMRAPPSIAEAEAAQRLVLVVDDHPVNRMVLIRQVNALGYAAETAEDGADALRKWSTGRFAAVITDCNMPELSGYQLASLMRSRERERDSGVRRTAIIACTANALGGDAEKCYEAGMDDYLAKPVALEQLAAKLARWLPREDGNDGRVDTSAGAADGPALDAATLADISGEDEGLAMELLSRFRHHNEKHAARLREALAAYDADVVLTHAHRIKGAARTIGAMALARTCEAMERAARTGDIAGFHENLPRFEAELRRLDSHIRERSEASR